MGSAEIGRELGDAGGPLLVGVLATAVSLSLPGSSVSQRCLSSPLGRSPSPGLDYDTASRAGGSAPVAGRATRRRRRSRFQRAVVERVIHRAAARGWGRGVSFRGRFCRCPVLAAGG
jgi:hypothetical protein